MSVNLLDAIQQGARKGTLLASCEPEVKELMHQIDVLLSSRQDESKSHVQALKSQLQQREREMSSLRVTVQERNSQVEKMKEDVKRLEQQLKVRSSDHETQLLRMRSELNRLTKSYEKLKTRRGLSEDRLSEMTALKEENEGLCAQCESQQSQITELSQQLGLARTQGNTLQEQSKILEEELNICRDELLHYKSKISENDKKLKENLASIEPQLKQCQESVKSRDRKIQSLRTERDDIRKKHKTTVDELQKLQESVVTQSNESQSYQVKVADLELLLTKAQSGLQNLMVENTQLKQQLTVAQELLQNKEKLIQTLDSRYKHKIESEVTALNAQMTDLLERLELMKKQESSLRAENRKLKEKAKSRHATLSPNPTELQSYRARLKERDQLVSSLEERVHHLEDQLIEATSVQSSSSISSSVGAGESPVRGNESTGITESTRSPMSSRSNSVRGTPASDACSMSVRSQVAEIPVNSIHSASTILQTSSTDSSNKVLETFHSGFSQLATPTDTPNDQGNSMLEMFKDTLDSVLAEHFNKMDKSLKDALGN